MLVSQGPSGVQLKRDERRSRVSQCLRDVQENVHWDTYFSKCPEAAAHAVPKVVQIIEEELKHFENRHRCASPSWSLPTRS
jgi:hypothetical protein